MCVCLLKSPPPKQFIRRISYICCILPPAFLLIITALERAEKDEEKKRLECEVLMQRQYLSDLRRSYLDLVEYCRHQENYSEKLVTELSKRDKYIKHLRKGTRYYGD